MKTCTRCKAEKPIEEFTTDSQRPDGKRLQCKECTNGARLRRYLKRADAPEGDPPPTRKCVRCEHEKPIEEFNKLWCGPHGYAEFCKTCGNAACRKSKRKIKEEDPIKYREQYHKHHVKTKYGVTAEQYDEMYAACEGKCELCGRTNKSKRLFVDHCHTTGQVRGLLCHNCNAAIGHARDNPWLLRIMADYVESYQHAAAAAGEAVRETA